MRSIARFIQGLVLIVGFFAIASIAEEVTRRQFGGPLMIHGLPISNADVTGEWHPDFLWMGKAWSIEVRSDEGIELTLDGRIYLIPKGFHSIYSNHDHTNTGEFGTKEFWGYPKKVLVGPLERKALTKR